MEQRWPRYSKCGKRWLPDQTNGDIVVINRRIALSFSSAQLRFVGVMEYVYRKSTDDQVRALKRLVIAATTFEHVQALCSHIESLGRETFTPLHIPLFAGVSVTYMKPFMRSDGLGPLPRRFHKFPNAPGYEKTHNDLKNGRDWYYAHRDALRAARLLLDPTRRKGFEDVILHVEETGVSFSLNEQSWSIDSVHRVRNLCDYQKSRIDKEMIGLLNALRNGRYLAVGNYILGRDFP